MNFDRENNLKKTFELLKNSYSPYSNFKVASSVITKNNRFFGGVNIENASYGLTMCAERNAIFNAISNGIKKEDIDYLILVSDSGKNLFPCGACLQVLTEFLDGNTDVIIKENNNTSIYKLKSLLPFSFKLT
jgi:cytidine deaminase|tara:strand:- start:6119 stop:6514 length:396 start_codon:yes stop_codon:yes gene_type:complete